MTGKPRLVGVNHVAIEVGDIDQALDFYGKIFDFTLRAKRPGNAFIELGDQFINMMEVKTPHEDHRRHFGLVVDDRSQVRELVEKAGGKLLPGPFLDFLDPWGNRVEIIEYSNIQFTKSPNVLRAMGFDSARTSTRCANSPTRAWPPNERPRSDPSTIGGNGNGAGSPDRGV